MLASASIQQTAPRYLPIAPDSKRPPMRNWPEEASPHLGDVHRWLRRSYRVGMTLDRLVCLDFDPAVGIEAFDHEFGALPLQGTSGHRAGVHYLFGLSIM